MKLGHFAALCCAVLAVLFGLLLYWDVQDDTFSAHLVFLPIMLGLLAPTLLVFPGGSATFQQSATGPAAEPVSQWLTGAPRGHKRAWLAALVLAAYLALWATEFLQGREFFSVTGQLGFALSLALLGFVFRRELFRR